MSKRFTWLKKGSYAPEILITDTLTQKDLTVLDCYELLNELYNETLRLQLQLRCVEQIKGVSVDENGKLIIGVDEGDWNDNLWSDFVMATEDKNIIEILKEIGIMFYDTWGNSFEDWYDEKYGKNDGDE